MGTPHLEILKETRKSQMMENRSSREAERRLVAAFFFVLICACGGTVNVAAERPNIVLIMVDDMGFSDLGCYGGEVDTPNLDRLASSGLRFSQFYNGAKCSQSRSMLLTGRYFTEAGMNLSGSVTIAEALGKAGYTTLMTGKWHLQGHPVDLGFSRYFGHLSGATNFFHGDNSFRLGKETFKVPKQGFYTTDANTDYAIRFLEETKDSQKPFFLYLAYNAPHYPLMAHKKDIEKYRGRFSEGWDVLRRKRYKRVKALGLLGGDWPLSPRPKDVPAWESLSEKDRKWAAYTMEVYAAMIDRVDQNIGRLMKKIDSLGASENTLFMFLSDNGGCPFQRTKTKRDVPGHLPESYITYHKPWANLSNTPFRLYKQNQHEGGISTPLIVHWPRVISKGGNIIHSMGHITDLMATCLEVAGAKYPKTNNRGQTVKPMRGSSLAPIFRGGTRQVTDTVFLQFSSNRDVRSGKWKLSWAGKGPWELYNMDKDRTELIDLSGKFAGRAQEMAASWEQWFKATSGGTFKGKKSRKNNKGNKNNKKKKPSEGE